MKVTKLEIIWTKTNIAEALTRTQGYDGLCQGMDAEDMQGGENREGKTIFIQGNWQKRRTPVTCTAGDAREAMAN